MTFLDFLKKSFLARVADRLDEESIACGKNIFMEDETAELRPDLTILPAITRHWH